MSMNVQDAIKVEGFLGARLGNAVWRGDYAYISSVLRFLIQRLIWLMILTPRIVMRDPNKLGSRVGLSNRSGEPGKGMRYICRNWCP
jgi:hypothetical protein